MVSADDPRSEEPRSDEPRQSASYGDVLEVFDVGRVRVTQRYGCTRRDQFELKTDVAFPDGLRDVLAARGSVSERVSLWVLDLPGAYQLTVAPRTGRALLLPRLSMERASQKRAALEIAHEIDGALERLSS